jgi:maleate isomerase
MCDSIGRRAKFAVLITSTNTSVQPECDDMRPAGMNNHITASAFPTSRSTTTRTFSA